MRHWYHEKQPYIVISDHDVVNSLLRKRAFASTTDGLWDGNLIQKSICACTTPASSRSYQNHERVFADLSSVQNQERKSQTANQRSCMRRSCSTICALSRTAVRSSICETANENRGGVTRTVTVDCSSP